MLLFPLIDSSRSFTHLHNNNNNVYFKLVYRLNISNICLICKNSHILNINNHRQKSSDCIN